MKVPDVSKTVLCAVPLLSGAMLLTLLLFPATGKAEVVRTGYTSIVAANSAKCLDISGASSAAGTSAIQLYCTSGPTQQWTVQNYNGSFRIVDQPTGDCLVIAGASTTAGAQLVQEPCSGVPSELWTFVANGSSFQIVSASTGQCASVSGASVTDSAYIVQEPCSTASNFLWTFSSGLITSTSLSVLQAAHSGQCLNVSGSSTTVGGVIIQYPCGGSVNEQWTLLLTGGYYELVANNSGLCLSNAGSVASGAGIVQSTCSASATGGLWTLTPVGGSYELIADNSGLCVTVPGASQTAATDLVQSACTGLQNQLWSLSAAVLPSAWTGVIQLPVDPIAVGNLPNGQLVMWSANDEYSFEGDIGYGNGQTYTAVFDPSSGIASEILVTNTGDDMFCPGTANLFNGNILVNGGDSSPKTSLYNPSTALWTSDADMNIPRGYEGDTVLTNGSVMTLGGSWSGGEGGKTAELWTQGSGWTVLAGVPETPIVGPDPQGIYRGDNHLWLFSAPNGQVFHAGPSAQMHWITTSGSGTITSAGNRGNDPYAINGNAVLYDVGMIMKTGGAPAYQDANAEANTYQININNGVNGVTVTQLAPMAYPRAFANGVVLPNGQVVIIGGQTYPVPFSDATAILIPEIWDPQTQVFRQLNAMQTPRVYHSTGILLPDGRVYEGGGGQCGEGCSANHFNTEILTPPYLLNADGTTAIQPLIPSASPTVALGGTISASTNSPVASFVLMRLSSVTHTVNNDQRRIPLQMQSTNGTSYILTVPSNPGIVLPGNYWLFALTAQGVPSVAANVVVTLGTPSPGFMLSPAPTALTVAAGSSGSSTISVTDIGGFSGNVTLAASGLPAGVTATFGTNPAVGSSVMTLAASSSVAAGTYAVTITGTSASLTASTAIALTITSGACTPTAITPYIRVNGAAWQEIATASVATGSTVNLGPQPLGGTWSWTGPNGFTSTAREIDAIPLSTGANTFVATYINASSCASTETFVVTVTAPAASFTISPSASTLAVTQGSSGTDTVTVAALNGFAGSVTLAASGLPSGVTASFGTNPATASSVLTLKASSSATTGTSTVTITGTSGSLTATTTIALTVSAPPSFTLSRSASTLSVTQGNSGTDTVAVIGLNGFAGSVTLAASGLPSGVTASFGTNPATASSVLTLKASSSATTGTSTVTITGTSGGLTATTTIALTINASCTPTAITPYLQVNGAAWQETATATVAPGATVNLGPQPLSGTWSWTGPGGFTSTARQINKIALSTGANTYVATYTNSSSCKSTQTFVITVN
jgi:galactose oxidase